MKFAIHDLSHAQLVVALNALIDAGVRPTVSDEPAAAPAATPAAVGFVAPAAAAPAAPAAAAPAAPAAAAPAAPAAAPAAPAAAAPADASRDSANMPWDARIHSGKNAQSSTPAKDGTWKRKRGITDEVFESVTQELRLAIPEFLQRTDEPAAPAAPAPAFDVASPAAPAAAAPAAPAAAAPAAPPAAAAPAAPPAAAPAAPAAPAAAVPAGINPYLQFVQSTVQQSGIAAQPGIATGTIKSGVPHQEMMDQISVAIEDSANPFDANQITPLCQSFGMNGFNECIDIAGNPDNQNKIDAIYAILGGQ